jgi:hypothetical protein
VRVCARDVCVRGGGRGADSNSERWKRECSVFTNPTRMVLSLSPSPPLNFSLGSASEADIRRIRVTPSPG